MTALHASAQAKDINQSISHRGSSQVETKSLEGIAYMLNRISKIEEVSELIQELGYIIDDKPRIVYN